MADEQPLAAARAELFASLRADLDDEATWSVLGDLLAAQGDVRGELIALDQRRTSRPGERSLEQQVVEHRVAELFDRHVAGWMGPLSRASNLELTWRRGFVLAATIHGRSAGAVKLPGSPTNLGIVATLARLLELPAAALLRELTLPRLAACGKPARLLADAAARNLTIDTLALPQARCDRFAPLAELDALRRLTLSSTTTRDLAELAGLPRLERLDLARSDSDLRAFERGFAALRSLDLRAHPNVASARLDSLAALHELRELDLGEGGWETIDALGHMLALVRLHLRGTDVFDLRPLARLRSLELLDLRGCPIADLEPIAELGELRELRIGWTRVRELRCLRSLTKLEVLEIAGTAVRDLDPLFDLPALVRIDVQGSDVRDVRPLTERGVQVLGRPQVSSPTWRDLAEGLLRK
ncbi:leucine-rich repeat domain-containing protein [Nannocystaceae bacterium ST9]